MLSILRVASYPIYLPFSSARKYTTLILPFGSMTYIINTKYRVERKNERRRHACKESGKERRRDFLVHTAVSGVTLDALAEGTVGAGCLCGVSQMGASLLKYGTLM